MNWRGLMPSGAKPGQAGIPNRKPKALEVCAGLVFRRGRLLITQRQAHEHLGGLWEFPGGKRERGESRRACLARELKEELGIEVNVGAWIATITHVYPEKSVRLYFFRCRWRRHEPRRLGCQALAWVRQKQLSDYAFPAADARLLAMLRQHPQWWREATRGRPRTTSAPIPQGGRLVSPPRRGPRRAAGAVQTDGAPDRQPAKAKSLLKKGDAGGLFKTGKLATQRL